MKENKLLSDKSGSQKGKNGSSDMYEIEVWFGVLGLS